MTDVIELLNERDDVEKTSYTRLDADDGKIKVELWHDTEGLQVLFEKAMDGLYSERGLQKCAKKRALVVRETRIENVPFETLYPDIVEHLKEVSDHDEDYEYQRNS